MIALNRVEDGWASCELEDHLEEGPSPERGTERMLKDRPFDGLVRENVYLHVSGVRELLEHRQGLHEPDVLVRVLER